MCRFILVSAFWLVVSPFATWGQGLSGVPAKIAVSAKPNAQASGLSVIVRIELRDPMNHPAIAAKNIEVVIEGKSDNGATERSKVQINQGQSEAMAELSIPTTGPV